MNLRLADIRQILDSTPGVLRALVAGLDDRLTSADYGPDTWSVREILAHLIFGEQTDWIPRLQTILQHGRSRPFEPFDRAGHGAILSDRSVPELLDLFDAARRSSLVALDAQRLTPADLARPGLHPALGPVTLGQLLATWAVHDLNHTAQIAKAIAFQARADVGPWEQYLSILAPPRPR